MKKIQSKVQEKKEKEAARIKQLEKRREQIKLMVKKQNEQIIKKAEKEKERRRLGKEGNIENANNIVG